MSALPSRYCTALMAHVPYINPSHSVVILHLSASYQLFYTSEIRGLGSYKGAAHELNPMPSPVPPSRPSATLQPLLLSVGPCRPTLG
ncbi:hypothetical protein PISMIDRAFT_13364 [Pisolithus microcarpus 441]|uniref:Unplaced genomic scaffold scaffold_92, whole genome shotgun sequence n=1 Tax=Pisolithus microcarpus 441 TaxID=765257 RepID=A0A0C9YT51_9AGAM|nr:hypothetical protein BKA83DRAFT_13364 [Pisolithus microcarpus]KIK19881.1 hypothetical protein PISMIDRAFT_13364 [Pisolithus microcarpus 441]